MNRADKTLIAVLLLSVASAHAQQDRPAAQFEVVDTNQDGSIDREEFDQAKRTYAIRSTFEQLDFDKDGKISAQEGQRGYEEREIDREVNAALTRTDTDKNGSVSRKEYLSSETGKRNPASFKTLDADGDGTVSKSEIRRAIIRRRGPLTSLKTPTPGIAKEPGLVAPKETPLPAAMPRTLIRNQPYDTLAGVDPRLLSLDVYAAEGAGPHPILVMVHGGAWSGGDKTGRGVIAPKARWFSEKGFIFASVNYRLSPAVSHPEHANDVAQAIAWLAEHAEEFNGDPERIFLMGHSAGAHIVAAVGTDRRHLERAGVSPTLIKGTIPLDVGAYDMSLRTELSGSGRRMYESAFGKPVEGRPDPWIEASPITYTREPGAADRIAPFLLVSSSQARRRVALANTHAFADALQNAGVRAEVVAVEKSHGECSSDIGVPGDALTLAVDVFLAQRLKELDRPTPIEE